MATTKKTSTRSNTARSKKSSSSQRSTSSKKGKGKIHKVMHEYKQGTLKSGTSNKKVKSRKQAVAIALSEARKSGAKIPKKRSTRSTSSTKKSSSGTRKRTTTKK